MDATPVTLGQEFGGYAAQVGCGVERLDATPPAGGRAAARRDGGRHRHQLACRVRWARDRRGRRRTGLPLTEARDHFEAQGARDALVELSGQLRTIAVSLTKIANDLRWMGSGPRAGLARDQPPRPPAGEQHHARQGEPGDPRGHADGRAPRSSATTPRWPGAARPATSSSTSCCRCSAATCSSRSGSSAAVSRLLADRCVDGITANVERLREYAESSPAIVTPLNAHLGYEEAASIAKQALAERKTIRQVVIERGHVARRAPHRGGARRGARRHADDPPLAIVRALGPGGRQEGVAELARVGGVVDRPVQTSRSPLMCGPNRAPLAISTWIVDQAGSIETEVVDAERA